MVKQNDKRIMVDANLYDKVKPILEQRHLTTPQAIAMFLNDTIQQGGSNLTTNVVLTDKDQYINQLVEKLYQLKNDLISADDVDLCNSEIITNINDLITWMKQTAVISKMYNLYHASQTLSDVIMIEGQVKFRPNLIADIACSLRFDLVKLTSHQDDRILINEILVKINTILDGLWLSSMLVDKGLIKLDVMFSDHVMRILYQSGIEQMPKMDPEWMNGRQLIYGEQSYMELVNYTIQRLMQVQSIDDYETWFDQMEDNRINYQQFSQLLVKQMQNDLQSDATIQYMCGDELLGSAIQLLLKVVKSLNEQTYRTLLINSIHEIETEVKNETYRLQNSTFETNIDSNKIHDVTVLLADSGYYNGFSNPCGSVNVTADLCEMMNVVYELLKFWQTIDGVMNIPVKTAINELISQVKVPFVMTWLPLNCSNQQLVTLAKQEKSHTILIDAIHQKLKSIPNMSKIGKHEVLEQTVSNLKQHIQELSDVQTLQIRQLLTIINLTVAKFEE